MMPPSAACAQALVFAMERSLGAHDALLQPYASSARVPPCWRHDTVEDVEPLPPSDARMSDAPTWPWAWWVAMSRNAAAEEVRERLALSMRSTKVRTQAYGDVENRYPAWCPRRSGTGTLASPSP